MSPVIKIEHPHKSVIYFFQSYQNIAGRTIIDKFIKLVIPQNEL